MKESMPLNVRRVYERELPPGGYVAIDVRRERSLLHGWRYHGIVVVERRAERRRPGHTPPVVQQATAKTLEAVVRELLPAAQCNAALGAALMRRGNAA